jgi:hypothetical protein
MATAPLEFAGLPTGLTLTATLYPRGSDTSAASGITLTENTNGKGIYRGSTTAALTGWHRALILEGTAVLAIFDILMSDDTTDHYGQDDNIDALHSTARSRTLDVSSGGEAGIDWANVGSPTTTLNLSGTTVKTATDVETDTADIQTRLPAALVSGRMDASVGAMAADVITAAAVASDANVEFAAAVWDRVLTGATHNIANSAGRRLRTVDAAFAVHAGTAQAGSTSTTIVLDTGASTVDDIYNGDRVVIVGGTGQAEHGIIVDYVGSTRTATMSRAWVVTPDATSEFEIVPADVDVEAWNHAPVTGDGDWSELQTDVDAILVDTDTTIPALIADVPTVAEFEARTIVSANYATAANLATVSGYLDTEVAAILAAVDTEVAAIKAKTDNLPASPAATGDAMTLTSGERDSIAAALLDLANGVESGLTPRNALKLALAVLAGKVTGGGTGTELFKSADVSGGAVQGTTTRATVTVDSSGNRSALTVSFA